MSFESKPQQFIPITFQILDSVIVQEWDKRGLALYLKMRRYVCRSNQHRMAAYWQMGYLVCEGYQTTWANWLGVSRSTVSRLLTWMENKGIIVNERKSHHKGDTNVYILGNVVHIEGSDKPVEIFFLDHHCETQETVSLPIFSAKDQSPILAMDIPDIMIPISTRSPLQESRSPLQGTLAPLQPFNKEESNIEELIPMVVLDFYKKNISKIIEPIIKDAITASVEEYGKDAVIEAIAIAVKQKKKTWAYVEGILKKKAAPVTQPSSQHASDGGHDF